VAAAATHKFQENVGRNGDPYSTHGGQTFGAFLVDADEGLVDHVADENVPRSGHPGEVGTRRVKGDSHVEGRFLEHGRQGNIVRKLELWQFEVATMKKNAR